MILLSSCAARKTSQPRKINSFEKKMLGTWRFEEVRQRKGASFKNGTPLTDNYAEDLITFKPDRTVELVDKKTRALIAKGIWEVETTLIFFTPPLLFSTEELDIYLPEAPGRMGPRLESQHVSIRKNKITFTARQNKEVNKFKLVRSL
jgi:hypothetical protein